MDESDESSSEHQWEDLPEGSITSSSSGFCLFTSGSYDSLTEEQVQDMAAMIPLPEDSITLSPGGFSPLTPEEDIARTALARQSLLEEIASNPDPPCPTLELPPFDSLMPDFDERWDEARNAAEKNLDWVIARKVHVEGRILELERRGGRDEGLNARLAILDEHILEVLSESRDIDSDATLVEGGDATETMLWQAYLDGRRLAREARGWRHRLDENRRMGTGSNAQQQIQKPRQQTQPDHWMTQEFVDLHDQGCLGGDCSENGCNNKKVLDWMLGQESESDEEDEYKYLDFGVVKSRPRDYEMNRQHWDNLNAVNARRRFRKQLRAVLSSREGSRLPLRFLVMILQQRWSRSRQR